MHWDNKVHYTWCKYSNIDDVSWQVESVYRKHVYNMQVEKRVNFYKKLCNLLKSVDFNILVYKKIYILIFVIQ